MVTNRQTDGRAPTTTAVSQEGGSSNSDIQLKGITEDLPKTQYFQQFSYLLNYSHLVLALSALLRPKYGTPYLFTSANPKHTLPSDVILRRTTFCQPILPPSAPYNAPWFSSETLALYKSLTYLVRNSFTVLTTKLTPVMLTLTENRSSEGSGKY